MNRAARVVVDASVGAKWVLPEADSHRSRLLLERRASGTAELLAPDHFIAEVANAIWKRSVLLGDIEPDEARAALLAVLDAPLVLIPNSELAAQALELALAFRHPVYDCLYVALAIRDGCPLVTGDRRLADAFGPATGQVIHLDDLESAW